jgi:death-on-curing protein
MTNYLTTLDVVAIHAEIMRRLGFAPTPLRDEGGLESAVMRPRMAAAYEDADHVRQATLLAIGISQAQAFLDGNKRTAFASLRAFLHTNGKNYAGDPLELARQLELVAERTGPLAEAADRFEAWLRERVA